MACIRCAQRGKTWSGGDPRCAFENGTFNGDNWNCATMNELREMSRQFETYRRDDMAAASIGYVPFEGDDYSGYIVMTWYKDRGRTGNAVIMWDDNPVRELTELDALTAIRQHVARRR